jgi:hypothetical protein
MMICIEIRVEFVEAPRNSPDRVAPAFAQLERAQTEKSKTLSHSTLNIVTDHTSTL